MANAIELCSLADLKTYLQITSAAKDALLTQIKAETEQFIMQYTGRALLIPATPFTEFYDGDGGSKLIVEQRPIVSIVSLYADPARLFQGGTQIPNTDITTFYLQDGTQVTDQIAANAGVIELYYYRFLRGRKNIKITYSAGYAVVPADLQRAVKLISAREYKLQDKQLTGETSQRVGDKTITLDAESIPKNAREILDRYVRIRI